MKKLIVLAATVPLVIAGIVISAAAPKVFVCKYVGTPGVDERLQTGQNPISVSSNAIKNYQGVGSYFNDAHGRSYVLEEDNGQPEPNVSKCPAPQTPPVTPPTTPPTTTTPPSTTTTPPTTSTTSTTSTSSSSSTANDAPLNTVGK